MKREEHEAESIRLFGKPYTEVHRWLDELAWQRDGSFNPDHRPVRHNKMGIEFIRCKFGDEAAKAAERHIRSDMAMEFGSDVSIPKDEEAYRKESFLLKEPKEGKRFEKTYNWS